MGLVVEPAIVIASPIEGINKPNKKQTATTPNATITLILALIPYSFQNNSSTVSLAGKTHNGEAESTAKNSAKLPYVKIN